MLRVFVSYSRNNAIAKQVFLQNVVRLFRQRCHFWDDSQITPGHDWRTAISHAISQSQLLIFLMSKDSLGSRNCREELQIAIDHGVEILPIKVERDTGLAQLDDAMLRTKLEAIEYVDMAQGWTEEVEAELVNALTNALTAEALKTRPRIEVVSGLPPPSSDVPTAPSGTPIVSPAQVSRTGTQRERGWLPLLSVGAAAVVLLVLLVVSAAQTRPRRLKASLLWSQRPVMAQWRMCRPRQQQ